MQIKVTFENSKMYFENLVQNMRNSMKRRDYALVYDVPWSFLMLHLVCDTQVALYCINNIFASSNIKVKENLFWISGSVLRWKITLYRQYFMTIFYTIPMQVIAYLKDTKLWNLHYYATNPIRDQPWKQISYMCARMSCYFDLLWLSVTNCWVVDDIYQRHNSDNGYKTFYDTDDMAAIYACTRDGTASKLWKNCQMSAVNWHGADHSLRLLSSVFTPCLISCWWWIYIVTG